MIDHFRARLVTQAALYSRTEILTRMGYKRLGPANFTRLETVLKSGTCGLQEGGFDFRFSAKAFLLTLSEVVGIDFTLAEAYVADQKQALEEERLAFKPWIWVDTGFVRRNQPIFALAACEHLRRIDLPGGTWRLPAEEQILIAATTVRQHYRTNQGALGIWGYIEQYWFCYGENNLYLLSCDGDVVRKHSGSIPRLSLATSSLDGR